MSVVIGSKFLVTFNVTTVVVDILYYKETIDYDTEICW